MTVLWYRMILFSALVSGFLMPFASFFSFWRESITYRITIDENAPLLCKTSEKFLSFSIDSQSLRNMVNLPILSKTFINLAYHLSPAFVRIGGTSSDCLIFNQTKTNDSSRKFENCPNFTITESDFVALNEFARISNLTMIFDLNVLIRNKDNTWNDENAKKIIDFASTRNFELDWQLGNEPNSFLHVFNRFVSAKQLAIDYQKLRRDLNEAGFEKSFIFGPEANKIRDKTQSGLTYIQEFLENVNGSIDFLTWHQYYLDGKTATVDDFINSTVFNYLPNEIEQLKRVQENVKPETPICISETSTAYGGGAPNLSDRFVAGFLWLDKLGYSARSGIKIVIRQTFFRGSYSMISNDLKPNPDWWISVAFKMFVSEKVLQFPNYNGNVRLYAHCSPEKSFENKVPAITIFGMNLNKRGKNILDFSNLKHLLIEKSKIFLYFFTSDSLQSKNIMLNGRLLELDSNGGLPSFSPKIYEVDEKIEFPNLSMIFAVIHGLTLPACNN